jgi:hypothetical protein
MYLKERRKESLKKAQHGKIKIVAGSVWLGLFMDDIEMCKIASIPPSTGLSRIHYVNKHGNGAILIL